MKILVAEDEQSIATSYKLLLESRNHEVVLSFDGEQCLQTFKEHAGRLSMQGSQRSLPPFDLLILDYRMPKKNGIEVAQQILSMVPDQRIIIASAYGQEIKQSEISHRLGQNLEMLHKPFEVDVFLGVVERAPTGSTPASRTRQSSKIGSALDVPDRNVPDNEFTRVGDISGIFGAWH